MSRDREAALKRCIAFVSGGEEADKYRDYYYTKPSVNSSTYSNRYDMNMSYSISSGQYGKGNINVLPGYSSSSSSASPTLGRVGGIFTGHKA